MQKTKEKKQDQHRDSFSHLEEGLDSGSFASYSIQYHAEKVDTLLLEFL